MSVPHQRISPRETRSQRRFASLRCVAIQRASRPGSARDIERVFVSDQIVTIASTASTSRQSIGDR